MKKNEESVEAAAAADIPQVSTVAKYDVVLRSVENGTPQFHVVRFDPANQSGLPTLHRLQQDAGPGSDYEKLEAAFSGGLLMGVPTESDATSDMTFRLDLDRLGDTIAEWTKSRAGLEDADTIAGPYDVVFDRQEASGRSVYVVRCSDKAPYQPLGTVSRMENPNKVRAVLSIFDSGTYLAFLQQTSLPIGFTCYLMNTEKFWRP